MIARPVESGRRQTALNVVETKRCVKSGNLKFCISRWMAGPNHRQRGEPLKGRKAQRVSDPMQRNILRQKHRSPPAAPEDLPSRAS